MTKLKSYIATITILFLLGTISCQTQQQNKKSLSYTHPIAFNPESYVCQFASDEISIDGKADEEAWKNAVWSNEFVDIEGDLKPKPKYKTQVKMLWDSSYFYFYAELREPHIWAKLKNRDDIIYYDDDFEIFIDPDGDSHNYYELEWNAYNTLWDLILLRPYRVDDTPKVLFEWNVSDVKSAVHIEGTINDPSDQDEYWSIEIALPWYALKELSPIKDVPENGDQWRVNFSRVDWTMEDNQNEYVKSVDSKGKNLPENNWVWSPTGKVNMHMPEMWGYVQFSSNPVGTPNDQFNVNLDEKIKWGLWNLYWQQIDYFKEHGKYNANLNDFTVPLIEACHFKPTINTTPFYFQITNPTCSGNGHWIIDKTGKIFKEE